jgi:hypothetical protein
VAGHAESVAYLRSKIVLPEGDVGVGAADGGGGVGHCGFVWVVESKCSDGIWVCRFLLLVVGSCYVLMICFLR